MTLIDSTQPQPEHVRQQSVPPLALVQGGPTSVDVQMVAMQDGGHAVMLRIEHATGSTVLPMTAEFATQTAKLLQRVAREANCAPTLVVPDEPRLLLPT